MRTLPILPRMAQAPQLLIRRGQHLQSLQRRHAQCQVPLRAVQALDLRRHLGDGPLRLQRSFAHAFDLGEEVGEFGFGILDALDRVGVGGGLGGDECGDVGVDGGGVLFEGGGDLRGGGEGGGVGKEGVEMVDGVVVDWGWLVGGQYWGSIEGAVTYWRRAHPGRRRRH